MNGRILILTASPLCRNPRVVKEAMTLGAAGYEVTVGTISNQARFEQLDLELMQQAPFKREVLNYGAATLGARTAHFFQRSSTWLARLLCRHLKIESGQALGPAASLLRLARTHPADLTIVHTAIPTWAAQSLLREGRRVAVDVEDWYSEDLLFRDRRGRPIRLLRRAEEFVLRRAAYASVTSASMAAGLVETYRCPQPVVIRNTFPRQPRSRVDRPPGDGTPRFIWFSQTVGPGRGLELFLAAWARTKNPSKVCFLGDERPGYAAHLMSRLPHRRRGDVSFLPSVSPAQLPETLTEFDVGLALEQRWPRNRDVTITNKIFQYLNAGLALIATDTAGQTEVMRSAPEAGLLLKAHETSTNAVRLDALIGDPEKLRAAQNAARAAAVTDFCWEKDAEVLLGAVERALARVGPS